MTNSTIAVFTSKDEPITLQNVEIPALESGEILVKIEYTTLCRSDLNTYCGRRIEKSPTILGHEIVGRIAAFGADAVDTDIRGQKLSVGSRVSWAIFASTPDTELDKQGIPQKGEGLFKYGHEQITDNSVLHGGLSQYIILKPHTAIATVDESVPVQVAAIINCAVATIAGAMRQAGDVRGKNVLICGAGMLGTIACAMCKIQGAASVSALDLDPARLEMAMRYGADHCFISDDTLTENISAVFGKPKPFHITIELSGITSAMEKTLELLTIGATAVWVGATYSQPDVRVNGEKIVRSLLTIKGLHNYNRDDFRSAVEFIEQHHLDYPFLQMIQQEFPLEEVNEAFEYALSANPFRVGLRIH
jgi:putative phosphonate catabolism associated alcohol dehydrogenase